jgi:hypothetical protein
LNHLRALIVTRDLRAQELEFRNVADILVELDLSKNVFRLSE